MYRAYKFRLKPTPEQAQIFVSWMGAGRWIWNQLKKQIGVEHTEFTPVEIPLAGMIRTDHLAMCR